MQKLWKLLIVVTLTAAAILSLPPKASANSQCEICEALADCVACCRCGGGSFNTCHQVCS
jgi:hypothetical protein